MAGDECLINTIFTSYGVRLIYLLNIVIYKCLSNTLITLF